MTPQRATVISGMMGLNTVAPLFPAEEVKYIVPLLFRTLYWVMQQLL
jgi:hypothetical protein